MAGADDFAGGTESIFVVYQKIGQVIVPEIPRKSVSICHFHQPVHTAVEKRGGFLGIVRLLTTDG